MFFVSKLVGVLSSPGNLLLLLLLLGTVLLIAGRRRTGIALTAFAGVSFLLIAVLPVGEWALTLLENRFPPPDLQAEAAAPVDGVIVLGGLLDGWLTEARGQVAINAAIERFVAFADLAERYPEAKLVFSGGSGWVFYQDFKEAIPARQLSKRFGLDEARVVWEDRSRNTYENAILSKAMVRPQPGERWLLVTSAKHMPRAVGVFRQAGWPVIPYPTDYDTAGDYAVRPRFALARGLSDLDEAVHEMIGLVAYRLLGRTDALFPGPR